MRVNAKAKTALAILGVVILLAACLACIRLAQAAGDAARLSGSETRPLGAEELAPEAAALPLVIALWDQSLYFAGSEYENVSFGQRQPTTDTTIPDKANAALVEAGVLPSCGEMYMPPEEPTTQELGLGFTEYDALTLWQGLAVRNMGWDGPEDPAYDFSKAAQNYVAYLGLDILGDWQPGQIMDEADVETEVLYSPSAQLVVQVVRDDRSDALHYYCGVYPTTRAAFAGLSLGSQSDDTGGIE